MCVSHTGYKMLDPCTLFLPPKPGEVTVHHVANTGDRDITVGHLGTVQKSNAPPTVHDTGQVQNYPVILSSFGLEISCKRLQRSGPG